VGEGTVENLHIRCSQGESVSRKGKERKEREREWFEIFGWS
jgi:hypothetical protein